MGERTRLLISVGGVAFAVLLILILLGLYQGFGRIARKYVDNVDADLWVAREGTTDMFHYGSFIPMNVGEDLNTLLQVNSVDRLIGGQVSFKFNGQEVHTYIMGYDTARNVAGPVLVSAGARAPGRGQIIIDRVFARNRGLQIGDRLALLGRQLEVAGISEQGNAMMYQYSFVTLEDAEEMLQMQGLANYLLVGLKDSSQASEAMQAINQRIPGVQAIPKAEMAQNNSKLVDETFLPIILVLVVIGFAVGVAIIGLTTYTATVEKSREYGVLKAVGASNGQLYRIIFQQSLMSGVLGYILGVAATFVITYVATRLVPSFIVSLGWSSILGALGLALLMGMVASYIPVRRIASIDPAIVFKS